MRAWSLWTSLFVLVPVAAVAAGDRVLVRLPVENEAFARGPNAGRMVVFLKSVHSRERGDPADGPFFSDPQPIVSVPVSGLSPGMTVEVGPGAAAWPGPLDELEGRFMVQAVFKRSRAEGGVQAPGNLLSEPVEVELDAGTADTVELELSRSVPPLALPESPSLVVIEEPSPMLTRATGRPVLHRAAVVLPPGYHDVHHARRMWPTVYVIPGFGGRMTAAVDQLRLFTAPGSDLAVPQAVHVFLDPEGPFGHHGFADSVINGPRGAALVQELVPLLEQRFRLIASPPARLLTGHSSGGWSSLWLQLTNPEFFGGCWSSAPDPVDFSAFQQSDLYRDTSLFADEQGQERGSFRRPVGPMEKVLMTVREEMGMERAIDPSGGSGQQWDAWCAMFGTPDPVTGMPARLADPSSGAIDRKLVEDAWSSYDMARLVERRWMQLQPVLRDKVRVLVGDRDNFYLERAVQRFREKVQALAKATQDHAGDPAVGDGFIEVVRGATHDTMASIARGRFALDMRKHLKRYGLGD
ncbi:MAG: alpha/beta hydrolase-fold protein [Phycisphaerales bacterium]